MTSKKMGVPKNCEKPKSKAELLKKLRKAWLLGQILRPLR